MESLWVRGVGLRRTGRLALLALQFRTYHIKGPCAREEQGIARFISQYRGLTRSSAVFIMIEKAPQCLPQIVRCLPQRQCSICQDKSCVVCELLFSDHH